MSRRKNKKHRINKNKLGVVAITLVVAMLCVVMSVQIFSLINRNLVLEEKKKCLEQILEDENDRTKDLEEEKVYAQTNSYIEDVAKSIGYIYPNEIIFRPVND